MVKARCYNHRDTRVAPATCAICNRIAVERRIAKRTVDVLLDAGFLLNVNNGGNKDELPTPSNKRAAVLNTMFATDDEYLTVYKADSPSVRSGWVRFVYGNDGWDSMSDYTVNLEDTLKPVNVYIDTLEGR